MTATSTIFDVIEQLTQSLPLDPIKVGQVLDTALELDAAGGSPVLSSYTLPGSTTDSRYESVELRIPHPLFGSGGGLLIANLKSDEGIDAGAIFKQYGLEFQNEVPSPRYPPGMPAYYNYVLPWGALSLGVTNDESAKLVSFVLKPK